MKRYVSSAHLGMTMLEVLLAVLLLAVFMGVFVGVTELIAQLLSGVKGGRSASELALARTTTRQYLNKLSVQINSVDEAQVKPLLGAPNNCLIDASSSLAGLKTWSLATSKKTYNWYIQQKQLGLVGDPIPLPGGIERVCLYSTVYSESSSSPGLYILQAEPLQAGPLSQPVRLLLCRPYYLCT